MKIFIFTKNIFYTSYKAFFEESVIIDKTKKWKLGEMMKLVVGLGNPGAKYRNNRHNIGFISLDEWAFQNKKEFNKVMFDAVFFEEFINGEKVIFLKPQTYMNLSGQAIRPIMNYFNIDLKDILVIYDDMDLPVGKIRLRQKGNAGGHNGIKSIISCLDSNEFNRIKVGVGRPYSGRSVTDHVLSGFAKEEQEDVLSAVQDAVAAIDDWIQQGDFQKVMNTYNSKS